MHDPQTYSWMENSCLKNSNITTLPSLQKRRQASSARFKNDISKHVKRGTKTKSAVHKLLNNIPIIDQHFTVIKKVGEGAFSNVFVATSKQVANKKFAIKHLTPTSHPSRIIQEIRCLQNIGGRNNVVGLELCFRNRDAVAFVMPYFPHDPFAQYFLEMNAMEIQMYMKNLLVALQHVHSFNIIHRDVKPSNFLYNRKEQRFLLVDFGLSQVDNSLGHIETVSAAYSRDCRKRPLETSEKIISNENKRPVLHSLSNNVPKVEGEIQYSKMSQKKKSPLYKENSPASKHALINRNINHVKRNLQFANITQEVKKVVVPALLPRKLGVRGPSTFNFSKTSTSFFRVQNSQVKSQVVVETEETSFRRPILKTHIGLVRDCGCDKKPMICNTCVVRKPMHAPRAGTPGYRSPEVLLKYPHQTTAVDIWSSGVMMLSILSGSYPFFRASDDICALIEIITVFGTAELKNAATKLGRNLLCNEIRKPLKLNKLCEKLRGRRTSFEEPSEESDNKLATCHSCFQKIFPNEGCLCSDHGICSNLNEKCENVKPGSDQLFPAEAYDLLTRLLSVDPGKRFTAEAALKHPFFQLNLTKGES